MGSDSHGALCSARYAGFLATGLRKPFQNPTKLLSPFVGQGSRAVDLGSGPGFFTTALAELVGPTGHVVAVDMQPEMLEAVSERAKRMRIEDRIETHLCQVHKIGLEGAFDFGLIFYVLHEVPDPGRFLSQAFELLKPGGRLLVVEPKIHVSASKFATEMESASGCGFVEVDRPRVFFSRTSLLQRPAA